MILFQENFGFTKAHNLVYENYILSRGYKYLLLLNNDAFAAEDWVSKLINSSLQNNAAMVSSKMINYFSPDKMDNAGHMLLNTAEILPIGNNDSVDKYDEVFENFGACAGACLYKMNMLKEIGFFDPYFNIGYEDVELGMRAKLFGYKCLYEPEAIVYHKMSQSINKIRSQEYTEYIQTSIFYSYLKVMPRSILLWNLPIMIIKYSLVFIFNLLTLRLNYIKSFLGSLKNIVSDFPLIKKKRTEIFELEPSYDVGELRESIHFFLGVDIKRAIRLFRSK